MSANRLDRTRVDTTRLAKLMPPVSSEVISREKNKTRANSFPSKHVHL